MPQIHWETNIKGITRKLFWNGAFDLYSSSPISTLLTHLPDEEFSRDQKPLLFACDTGSQPNVIALPMLWSSWAASGGSPLSLNWFFSWRIHLFLGDIGTAYKTQGSDSLMVRWGRGVENNPVCLSALLEPSEKPHRLLPLCPSLTGFPMGKGKFNPKSRDNFFPINFAVSHYLVIDNKHLIKVFHIPSQFLCQRKKNRKLNGEGLGRCKGIFFFFFFS